MKSNASYSRAMRHISHALQFGTVPMSNIPTTFKLMLVRQPSLVNPEFILKLSSINQEFRRVLDVARQLYHSWVQNVAITDNEVHQALSFSSQLFCYAPARIQEDVHTARNMVNEDPHALQRCVDVLGELDVLYNAAVNKDTFIRARFSQVRPNRFMIDENNHGPDGTVRLGAHQGLHPHTVHTVWGTPAPILYQHPIHPPLYGDEVLDNYNALPGNRPGVQVYKYRPTKYTFFKRKEKIRRAVNKYYIERQIADLEANDQEPGFLHWHNQLRNMQDLEIAIRTPMSTGEYQGLTCYEKEYIYQLILSPIEHNVANVLDRTQFEMYRSQADTKCVRIIITASVDGEWISEHEKQMTHRNMQKILQDTVSLVHVMVGDPLLAHAGQTQNIEPTQLQLELRMQGQVYGQIDNHDEWFNR